MAKNVTGGIILLLGGSVLVSLVATKKGQEIMGILTGDAMSTTRGGGFTSGSQAQPAPKTSGGNSGFSGGRGGGFTVTPTASAAKPSSNIPDYSKMFGYVGERAASPT